MTHYLTHINKILTGRNRYIAPINLAKIMQIYTLTMSNFIFNRRSFDFSRIMRCQFILYPLKGMYYPFQMFSLCSSDGMYLLDGQAGEALDGSITMVTIGLYVHRKPDGGKELGYGGNFQFWSFSAGQRQIVSKNLWHKFIKQQLHILKPKQLEKRKAWHSDLQGRARISQPRVSIMWLSVVSCSVPGTWYFSEAAL